VLTRELAGEIEHLDELAPALRAVLERRSRPEALLDLEAARFDEPLKGRTVR
jgi:hypothetical protein